MGSTVGTSLRAVLQLKSIISLALAMTAPAIGQHPSITLYDKDFNEINPITGENAETPFSTEVTCGLCHDYETITGGYHFQLGWDHIADDYETERGRPWSLSDGLMGRWYPYAFRQLAKKVNKSSDEIDLTVFDFVGFSSSGNGMPPCGACHPGGGGLQYDREGNRYDQHLKENPELRDTFDGDYFRSRWDESGVIEADCLLCHLEGYSFDERVAQLEQGNYQWAVVAGSRIGTVQGAVTDDEIPKVIYERRLFNEDGTLTLDLSWPPPDDNCMYCHGTSDIRKRGFSWNDIFNSDIHNSQGISCTACHPAGLEHQFAKGIEPAFKLAADLDGTIQDCTECHSQGYLGAPIPDHFSVKPSHIDQISCEGCHIPFLNRAAAKGLDYTAGEVSLYPRPEETSETGEIGQWRPGYDFWQDGKLHPVNPVMVVWWGNRDADGLIYPLFIREHEAAWKLFSGQVEDDSGDGIPEVNREDEIISGLKAFERSLQGNTRFSQIQPVLIKGENAYELDDVEGVRSTPLEGTPLEETSFVSFSIDHNTAPTRMALGANGCSDCHVSTAHFFKGARVIDLFGPDGQALTLPNGLLFGCNPFAFAINSFHQQIISPYVGPVLMFIIFLIVIHYHGYGPKRITFDPYSEEIQRFSMPDRITHLFRLVAFLILAVTGLIMAFNLHLWQQLLFPSPQRMLDFHIWSGVVFIITTFAGIWLWFRDALFASYDRVWVKKFGGYLWHKGEVPAGRFNAGQKMFYWYTAGFGVLIGITGIILVFRDSFTLSTICLTSTLHNLLGFIIIAGVVAHAYLGTVANPGTWRVLVDGSVSREWARHHHPNWYHTLVEKGVITPKKAKQSKGTRSQTPENREDSRHQ
jgi:formate dehydrogenase gamma subunit